MLAIIKSGGKQYKISKGSIIEVEKAKEYCSAEQEIEITDILLLQTEKAIKIGKPFVQGAKVKAKVVKAYKSKKVLVFKKKARTNYRRKKGHRQNLCKIEILDIVMS